MIVGALAYKSAKRRMLGEVATTVTRRLLEGLGIVLIVLSIVILNNLKYLIVTDPVTHFVIPVWAIVAYLAVGFRSKKPAVQALK